MTQPSLDAAPMKPLYSRFADDEQMADRIGDFVEELPDRAAAIQNAAEQADAARVGKLAYQLEQAADACGFEPICEAAQRIEQLVTAGGDPAALKQAIRELCSLSLRARVK